MTSTYLRRKLAGDCGSCGHALPSDCAAVLCDRCRARNQAWKQAHPDRVRAHQRRYVARRT